MLLAEHTIARSIFMLNLRSCIFLYAAFKPTLKARLK